MIGLSCLMYVYVHIRLFVSNETKVTIRALSISVRADHGFEFFRCYYSALADQFLAWNKEYSMLAEECNVEWTRKNTKTSHCSCVRMILTESFSSTTLTSVRAKYMNRLIPLKMDGGVHYDSTHKRRYIRIKLNGEKGMWLTFSKDRTASHYFRPWIGPYTILLIHFTLIVHYIYLASLLSSSLLLLLFILYAHLVCQSSINWQADSVRYTLSWD